MQITQFLHRADQSERGRVCTIFRGRTRTYGEVVDRVARFAGALRGLGVEDGARVAMYSLNSDNYHEYLLAVPWAGGIVVPVNVRWSAAEVAYSFVDSDTRIVLIDDTFAGQADAIRAETPHPLTFIHCGDADTPDGMLAYEDLIAGSEPVEDARRRDTDLYGIYYTGGTTGRAKGVMLDHRALLTSAMGTTITSEIVTPGGVLLHAAPMFHLADGAAWNIANLTLGTHVIVPSFTPAEVAAAIQQDGVTDVLLVPTMIQMLLSSPDAADADFTSMKNVIYGASPMSESLLQKAMARFDNARFAQAYGQTELAPITTLLTPEDHQRPELARSCGRPPSHSEVRIAGPDDQTLPPGEVGEILSRGNHVMQGYWSLPEETAEALRGGWMHSGDLGYMDEDGYLYVVDRLKDMIITGGENVYSIEVENALATHPKIAQCAVVGAPDDDWGERVHAYLILRDGEDVELEEIQAFCKDRIANYKVPRSIEVVPEFPVSGAGKILKKDLREALWADARRGVN